jgi:hypothetical protein
VILTHQQIHHLGLMQLVAARPDTTVAPLDAAVLFVERYC